jgi:hypothetical protein
VKPAIALSHVFVEAIPEKLEERKLYVSIRFSTVVHKCACGCGTEVVTPIHPTRWRFTYDGSSISLYPSVGNWSYACRSHYWIKRNKVIWSRSWSDEEIQAKQSYDESATKKYFGKKKSK